MKCQKTNDHQKSLNTNDPRKGSAESKTQTNPQNKVKRSAAAVNQHLRSYVGQNSEKKE